MPELVDRVGAARERARSLGRHREVLLAHMAGERHGLRSRLAALRSQLGELSTGTRSVPPPPATSARPVGPRRHPGQPPRSSPPGLQDAAELFARTRSPRLKAEVVHRCGDWSAALARGVARGSRAEADDLGQVALLAVARALDRYDPARGRFEPYARATVAGEVRHYLRATVWPIHVPRSLQDAYRALAVERDENATPGGAGVSSSPGRCGLAPDATAAVVSQLRHTVPLETTGDAVESWTTLAEVDARLETAPDRLDLRVALYAIPELDREVVDLLFFEELSQRAVAEKLGISQAQVSRIAARALERLRRQLGC